MSGLFFNEKPEKQRGITPTLAELIRMAVQTHSDNLRVCMPATVETYDHKKQVVSATPDFKNTYADGQTAGMPMIYDVPVCFPRAGAAFICLPLKKGDKVLLVFCDRSLEKWLSSGAQNDPADTRAHHLSDAIAFPGCYPTSSPAQVNNANDLIIKNGKFEIRMRDDGRVQILNGQWDLMKLFDQWIDADASGAVQELLDIKSRIQTFMVGGV